MAGQLAAPLADLAGDQDGVDVAGVREGGDRRDRVGAGGGVDVGGPDQDDVGLLAGSQGADLVGKARVGGAADRREPQHVRWRELFRRVLLTGHDAAEDAATVLVEQRLHLGEHAQPVADLVVAGQPGHDAGRPRLIDGRESRAQAEGGVGARGQVDRRAGALNELPGLVRQGVAVVEGILAAEQARGVAVGVPLGCVRIGG